VREVEEQSNSTFAAGGSEERELEGRMQRCVVNAIERVVRKLREEEERENS